MFDGFWSGLFGGLFGPAISRWLGRFRLWKVFIAALLGMYIPIFLFGICRFGLDRTLPVMRQILAPPGVFIFLGLATLITFCAFIGSTARSKKE